MVLSCSAYKCYNRFGTLREDGKKLQFHRFPLKNPELLKKWVLALRRQNFTPTYASTLCGSHFTKNDYKSKLCCYLKEGAVPSVFDYTSHLCKPTSKNQISPIRQPLPLPTSSNFTEMPTCSAYGCTNRVSKRIPGVTFHRFPKDRIQRAEWIKAVRRANFTPTSCSRLCSEHFKESDFDRTPFRTFLKSNAVPSIFKGFPNFMQKKTKACIPVSVSDSPPTKQVPSEGALAPRIENVYSTNKIEVCQNKPEAMPTFGKYGENDCGQNTLVIVSDSPDYKNALNGQSDANHRIVIPEQLILKNGISKAFVLVKHGSANNEVVVQNESVATPTFTNFDKNNCDKNTAVIASAASDYKNVLNGYSDANRRIVISDQLNLKNKSSNVFAHIENVGSTNNEVVVKNKSVATPTFTNYVKNDCDKNTMVIVSDTPDYQNVLNSDTDTNRRIVISDQLNLENKSSNAFAHVENVGLTNNEVVVKNKSVATPTFTDCGKNMCDKNRMVIVSDTPDYQNVLNSDTDTNRRIVISDQLIMKNRSGSSLANTYQSNAGSTVPVTYEQIDMNMCKKEPLLLFDDEHHSQRIKELEEVFKSLYRKRKNWIQKIRRIERKVENVRKELLWYTKKNRTLLSCNSQPVVHFLALDVKNV